MSVLIAASPMTAGAVQISQYRDNDRNAAVIKAVSGDANSGQVVLNDLGVLTLSGVIDRLDVQSFANKQDVISVIALEDTVLPKDCSELFKEFPNVKRIVLKDADSSNVESMSSMFENCPQLEIIDMTGLDTSSVTDMSRMFEQCSSLTSLDLSTFNTAEITSFESMFENCRMLKGITFGSNFTTSKCADMSEMFKYCTSLQTLDLTTFDTSAVGIVSSVFDQCTNITTIIVSDKWDLNNIPATFKKSVFFGCENIVGGNGTTVSDIQYNKNTDYQYAVIDKPGQAGFFLGAYSVECPENIILLTEPAADGQFPKGTEVKFTTHPGYNTDNVKVNGEEITPDSDGIYSFIMPDNDTGITSDFEKKKFKVILPDHMEPFSKEDLDNGEAEYGAEIPIKVSEGYTASDVKANDDNLTPDDNGIYTVSVGAADVTVTANIQKL